MSTVSKKMVMIDDIAMWLAFILQSRVWLLIVRLKLKNDIHCSTCQGDSLVKNSEKYLIFNLRYKEAISFNHSLWLVNSVLISELMISCTEVVNWFHSTTKIFVRKFCALAESFIKIPWYILELYIKNISSVGRVHTLF